MYTQNKEYSNRRKRHHPLLRSLRRKHKKQKRNLKTKRQTKVKMKHINTAQNPRCEIVFFHDEIAVCLLFTVTRHVNTAKINVMW